LLVFPLVAHGTAITGLSRESFPDRDVVKVEIDSWVEPLFRYSSQENCWQIDMVGVGGPPPPVVVKPFCGPVLALRCGQVNSDPPIQRISLNVQPGVRMKVVRSPHGFRFELKKTGQQFKGPVIENEGRIPQPLISPHGEVGEVVVDVRNEPAIPVLAKLVEGAGFDLHFRDPVSGKVSLKVHATNSLEALRACAVQLGMVLTRENDGWWLSRRDNPLLAIPIEGKLNPVERGATVGQFLRNVAGEGFFRRLKRPFPPGVEQRLLAMPNGLENPRTIVQCLLESHGIQFAAN